MGQRVNIVLFDDIDGAVGEIETFRFGLDGKSYEIDVTRDKAEKAREALELFVKHGREVGKAEGERKSGNTGATKSRIGASQTQIRNWANANGIEVSQAGRLPKSVVDAYDQAHESKVA